MRLVSCHNVVRFFFLCIFVFLVLLSAVDHCFSNPCSNNGTCHNALHGYNCSCPKGFAGSFCEEGSSVQFLGGREGVVTKTNHDKFSRKLPCILFDFYWVRFYGSSCALDFGTPRCDWVVLSYRPILRIHHLLAGAGESISMPVSKVDKGVRIVSNHRTKYHTALSLASSYKIYVQQMEK